MSGTYKGSNVTAAAEKLKTLVSKKQQPTKHVLAVKVMDFTVWKGFKFGFGIACGFAGFTIIAAMAGFLLKLMIFGFMSLMYGLGGSPL